MTSQNYSQVWYATSEQAMQQHNEVKVIVVDNDPSHFFAFSTFIEAFYIENCKDATISHASVYDALRDAETWMYGYLTSYSKPLVS